MHHGLHYLHDLHLLGKEHHDDVSSTFSVDLGLYKQMETIKRQICKGY
jgi:hypothetical protein